MYVVATIIKNELLDVKMERFFTKEWSYKTYEYYYQNFLIKFKHRCNLYDLVNIKCKLAKCSGGI